MANKKEELEEVKKDLNTYQALEAVGNSEGGKILAKSLKDDVIYSLETIIGGLKSTPEMELRAEIARLAERLELFRSLINAEQNKRDAYSRLLELDPEEDNPNE